MKLVEISQPDMVPVWRSFACPMDRALNAKNIEDVYPRLGADTKTTPNGYAGEWVSLSRKYSHEYGKDLGTVPDLSIPLLATFLVPKDVFDSEPVLHRDDDDADIPGETKRLPFGVLGPMVYLEMYLGSGNWVPFDQQKLQELVDDPKRLDHFIDRTQEIGDW